VATEPDPGFRPADPDFERATGTQTLMTIVGRSGVKD
jgi:hypothetical protein